VKTRILTMALLALVAVSGCGRGPADDQATGSIRAEDIRRARDQLSPEVRAHLDAGNEAYRDGRYPEAREHFEQAARLDPDAAAAWFGIYMVESATADSAAAATAIRRAREAAPRASLLEDPEAEP
jgi:tetratricopeptide (TPR) repeat protein